MQLQGRILRIDTQGEDVALLHRELIQLGFTIPRDEIERQFFGPGTQTIVLEFQSHYPDEDIGGGIVESRTATLINAALVEPTFVVRGHVRNASGEPIPGWVVQAFDRDLRTYEKLGETSTNAEGFYEITYKPFQFRRAEKKRADLIVVAFASRLILGSRVRSPLIFNAPAEVTVDLGGAVYEPSEYEQYLVEIAPLLENVTIEGNQQPTLIEKLADLKEDPDDEERQEITFVAGETGIDPQRLALLVTAAQLALAHGMQAEAFYGLFRQGLPSSLPELLAQSPQVQRRALEEAISANIMPARFRNEIDSILARLQQLIVEHAFKAPETRGRYPLSTLLGTMLATEAQRTFLTQYVQHAGPPEEFWDKLRQIPEFSDSSRIAQLQYTLQLAALTANHVPLVQDLQRDATITSLRDLARFDAAAWQERIQKTVTGTPIGVPPDVPGQDDAEKARNYANILTQIVEEAFPTAVIARYAANDQRPDHEDVRTFLRNNPAFEFRDHQVDHYLKSNPEALQGVVDQAGVTKQLKGMERLFKLTPRYPEMQPLLADGIDSAYRITRMGQTTFVRNYSEALGGEPKAEAIYAKAEHTSALALNLLATYGVAFNATEPRVTDLLPALKTEFEHNPDWETLFGSLSFCECEHCRSVLSPAAYLVDIMAELNRHSASAKHLLSERRPDIGDIELSCENTNTLLPYVDLVNEVLEDAVARFTPFNLPPGLEADLNSRALSPALRNLFTPPLSPDAVITVVDQGQVWSIDDLAGTYTISTQSGQLRVVSRRYQTKGSAAERAANPQYVNDGAYEVLRQCVYPWSLPFDLWVEEARTYLGHLGVPRSQLMQTFLPGERQASLNNWTIAQESLGLTSAEARIITGVTVSQPGAASPGPWNLWGFAAETLSAQDSIPDPADSTRRIVSGNWLVVLSGRVDVFLQQSGLQYQDMLALLRTYYVNPVAGSARSIQLVATDPNKPDACELDKLGLVGLDQAAAARIVCFVRLWRTLGWTMRDLDLACLAFGSSQPGEAHIRPAELTNDFLVSLAHVKCLHEEFHWPVHRLLAWWATNLREEQHRHEWWTTDYIDHSAAGQPLVPSLYAQLFRNRTVTNPIDPAFTEKPSGLSGKLSAHIAPITAALGISAADFALLLGDANVIPRDPADVTRPEDRLSLDSLAWLYRHATLARALKLPVRDYLTALRIISANPFGTAADTALFVEQVNKVRRSGFTMVELAYLLRHEFTPSSGVAPGEAGIAVILDEIRSGLQKVAAENTFSADHSDPGGVTTDPNGDLTRQKLALLNWDSALIEQVVATLNGAVTYRVPLDPLPFVPEQLPNDTGTYEVNVAADLPPGFTFPAELRDVVTHEAPFLFVIDAHFATELDTGQSPSTELRQAFTNKGRSLNAQASVTPLTPGANWRIDDGTQHYAIVKIEQLLAVRDETNKKLRASRFLTTTERILLRNAATTTGDTHLVAAVDTLCQRQDELQGQISYDPEARVLVFAGPMTDIRRTRLKNVSPDLQYQKAIDALFNAPRQFVARYMRSLSVHDFAESLAELPAGLQFPKALHGKIYFDTAAEPKRLHCVGVMTEQERDMLLTLSNDTTYQGVINTLFTKPETFVLEGGDAFLTASGPGTDAAAMFDSPNTPEARFLLVLQKLLPYLQRTLSERLVEQKIAEALTLEAKVAEALLTRWVPSPADRESNPQLKRRTLAEFLAPAFVESDAHVRLTPQSFWAQFKTFTLLHKIATVVTRFKITARQLAWLFEYGSAAGWLALNTLPTPILPTDPPESAASFDGWLRFVDLFGLRDGLPMGELALDEVFSLARTAGIAETDLAMLPVGFTFPAGLDGVVTYDAARQKLQASRFLTGLQQDLLQGAAVASHDVSFRTAVNNLLQAQTALWEQAQTTLLQRLGLYTGWDAGDLEYLVSAQGFNFTRSEAFQDERALVRLWTCFVLLKRLGMSAQQCPDLAEGDVASEAARGVMHAVKAKYDEAQWLNVAKPLRDVLRDQQRAALVAYLVAHPDESQGQRWRGSNDLYAHFCIDVEMSPCMMTSRIKQAIGSVQLFIQRCLMHLEGNVITPGEADTIRAHWTWMKNYRVWEANRKVFLWPENWIEPELRDNKSPFFKDLENELLQNEVTRDTAEMAFLHYLEKLDQIARLEIIGMYHQEAKETGDKDMLHVFGRTMDIPHIYYYCQGIRLSKQANNSDYSTPDYWTPWEKVGVDIEGDALIPVVWNRRLYLFWPIFTEKANDTQTPNNQGRGPEKHLAIQLAWSEYKNKRWSAKNVSTKFLVDPSFLPKEKQVFKALFNASGDLFIRCFHKDIIQGIQLILEAGDFHFTGCHGEILINDFSNTPIEIVPPLKSEVQSMMFSETNYYGEDILYLPTGHVPSGADADTVNNNKRDAPTLNRTPGTFRILYPHQDEQFLSQRSFFYQDNTKTFLVTPRGVEAPSWLSEKVSPGVIDAFREQYYLNPNPIRNPISPVPLSSSALASTVGAPHTRPRALIGLTGPRLPDPVDRRYRPGKHYRFETFYHPYVCEFIRALNRDGIAGLLQRSIQLESQDFFEANYDPHVKPIEVVDLPYPREAVDFASRSAYSLYNWELFFHAPLLIADRLSKNQRFEEAQQWFHYIFDPTDMGLSGWKVRPFIENIDVKKRIDDLLRLLDPNAPASTEKEDMHKQVDQWRDNPFNPHLLARLRMSAYQKTVVMKYIDNLIAWGDQLFRRDTIESINEATLLYILVAELLGPRPQKLPARLPDRVWTYNELENVPLDPFGNAFVEMESSFAAPGASPPLAPHQPPLTFYFCIPQNDKLLGYWDTVADRLFKIRHCMTIEGVVRQLPLFEPPIDPGLLVRAFAAGVDISSILNDINAAVPHYRFNVMAQKATELCNDVKALGAALLSALEKKDAEALALLRSSHEIALLTAVRQVREHQIEESKEALAGLLRAKAVAESREKYYEANINQGLIPTELLHLTKLEAAHTLQTIGQGYDAAASFAHLIPDFDLGAEGAASSPVVKAIFGGSNIASALQAFSRVFSLGAATETHQASMASMQAGFDRRLAEWGLQKDLATKEKEQIDKQIAAAQIRVALAEKELENHDLQVQNAKEVDEFMRDKKYTNMELYNWMVGQISSLYFQSYQLAYDVAKRTERAYRYELGLRDSNFIQFGYWDSLKKGLLAGEKLSHDLKRMEIAYLDQNKREYEIIKHISLLQLDPLTLIQLRQTGECFVSLPEVLFDLDYPGHYLRRIKSVSLTIPCITGPYTSVNCTLTLLKSSIRHSNTLLSGKYARQDDDPRFTDSRGAIQSIVTSSGQNDSGLFETNLRDERLLFFEGAGAISEWHIELSRDFRPFDYDTISDVLLHVRYTAWEGGGLLKQQTALELQTALNEFIRSEGQQGLAQVFSLRHDLPTEWYRFLNPPADATGNQTLTLNLGKERFPFLFANHPLSINAIELFITVTDAFVSTYNMDTLKLTLAAGATAPTSEKAQPDDLLTLAPWNGLLRTAKRPTDKDFKPELGMWTLNAWLDNGDRLDPTAVENVVTVCHYAVGYR